MKTGAGALRADRLHERMILVRGQAGVVHPGDLVVLLQVLGNGQRVLAVLGHAQRQRLDAGDDEEGVEGRHGGAQIAQAQHAAGDGEGEVAEGLGQLHAVVAGVGVDQRLEAVLGAEPVEGAAVDDHAADGVAVPAHELGERVHDDVGAVVLGAAQVGRGQRVVDDQRHAGLLGDGGNRRQVDDDAAGVGDRLAEDGPGLGRDGLGEALGVGGVGPFDVPVELLEGVVELVDRAAVELPSRDELVAGLHQGVEHDRLRGMPRGNGECRRAALERGDALLQHRLRGAADARVDVAERLQAEQRGGVVDVVEDIGRGLVDGRDARARGRIGRRPGVDGERRKSRRCVRLADIGTSSRLDEGPPEPIAAAKSTKNFCDLPSGRSCFST